MTLKKTFALLACLLMLGAGICGALFFEYLGRPLNPHLGTVTIQIPRGANFSRISAILEKANLVDHRRAFYVLVRLKDASRQIKAGEYELTGAMTPVELIETLKAGSVKEYRVSIPEGFTMVQIADRLEACGVADSKVFLGRAGDEKLLAGLDIPAKTAEGYLFPDTYVITKSMDEVEILRYMTGRFRKEITPAMRTRARELGFSLHEMLTLASIIEKESALEEEKPLISAVFHNRMKRGMRLQSDPTVIYGIKDFNGNITRDDLKRNTPYNTYRIKGLPPGPICNPSASSIGAALYPSNVKYLYFVAKNDGSHQFSSDLSTHDKAVIKYQIKRQK